MFSFLFDLTRIQVKAHTVQLVGMSDSVVSSPPFLFPCNLLTEATGFVLYSLSQSAFYWLQFDMFLCILLFLVNWSRGLTQLKCDFFFFFWQYFIGLLGTSKSLVVFLWYELPLMIDGWIIRGCKMVILSVISWTSSVYFHSTITWLSRG